MNMIPETVKTETGIIITKEQKLFHKLVQKVTGTNEAYCLETPEGGKALLCTYGMIQCRDCVASRKVWDSAFEKDLLEAGLSKDDLVCTEYYEDGLPCYVPGNGFCHNAIRKDG